MACLDCGNDPETMADLPNQLRGDPPSGAPDGRPAHET